MKTGTAIKCLVCPFHKFALYDYLLCGFCQEPNLASRNAVMELRKTEHNIDKKVGNENYFLSGDLAGVRKSNLNILNKKDSNCS